MVPGSNKKKRHKDCLNLHNACDNAILAREKKKKSAWEIQGRLQEAENICFSDINVCEGFTGPRKRGSNGQS